MNFNEIDNSRRVLGLDETATLEEIKKTYRKLAHQHHPDKNNCVSKNSSEMMKELNRAYKVLMDYCNAYRYSFQQEDVSRVYPKEEDLRTWRQKWSF